MDGQHLQQCCPPCRLHLEQLEHPAGTVVWLGQRALLFVQLARKEEPAAGSGSDTDKILTRSRRDRAKIVP